MTINQLLAAAGIIKNETTPKANTHTRIGVMFENIINYLQTLSGGSTINGKQKHFYQTTPPAANLVDAGDEWVDTNPAHDKIKYTWTGYSWVNFNE